MRYHTNFRLEHQPGKRYPKAKTILLVWISLSLFWMSCPAVAPGQPLGAESCIEIIDALGKQVEIKLPVKKMVVLNSDALEVVRSLKVEGLVVGVFSEIAKNPLFWPVLKDKPKVGSWRDANPEIIATDIREEPDGSWALYDKNGAPFARMPKDGLYFDFIRHMRPDMKIDPNAFQPPMTMSDDELDTLARRAEHLYENTDKALLGWGGGCLSLMGLSWMLGINITQGPMNLLFRKSMIR